MIGFRLAGIRKTYDVTSQEMESKIKDVLSDRMVAILVVNNDDLRLLSAHTQQILNDSVEPTVIAIGGKGESTTLRDKIKQAVGVDLWK